MIFFTKTADSSQKTTEIYFCQMHINLSPSLHSRATRDSRLSICICSLFKVRSLSRDLRLYAMSTTTMTRMSMAPATAMLIIAVLLRGLSDMMSTTPGENSMPPTRALWWWKTEVGYNSCMLISALITQWFYKTYGNNKSNLKCAQFYLIVRFPFRSNEPIFLERCWIQEVTR